MTNLDQWMKSVRERAEKATKGPWDLDIREEFIGIDSDSDSSNWVCYEESYVTAQDVADFKFIQKSIIDLPLALQIIEIQNDALKYYSESPAFKEATFTAISSNFKSNNCADRAIKSVNDLIKKAGE